MTIPTPNHLISTTGLIAPIHELPGREPFMLAADLAATYGTETKRITEQVQRNLNRFPEDFAFRLAEAEMDQLRSQNATKLDGRDAPLAFTHAGALALSGVLKTPMAAEVSVVVHRAFAAMERQAYDAMRYAVMSLRTEAKARSAIRVRIVDAVEQGLSFDAIWRQSSTPRPKLERLARECLALGLIDHLPAGTPPFTLDLFGTVDA